MLTHVADIVCFTSSTEWKGKSICIFPRYNVCREREKNDF